MGVGVAGRKRYGLPVGGDRFVEALQLVKDVAQIEISQHISGIGLGGVTIEFFGAAKLAQVEKDGAQIDARRGVIGIDGENLFVELDGAMLFARFLGLNGGLESLLNAVRCGSRRTAAMDRGRRRAKQVSVLPCARSRRATGGGWDPPSRRDGERPGACPCAPRALRATDWPCPRLLSWRAPSRGCSPQGTSSSRSDAQCAQLAKILKAVMFQSGNQPGSFPGLQLAGTDRKDAQNVLTAIAGHSDLLQALHSLELLC